MPRKTFFLVMAKKDFRPIRLLDSLTKNIFKTVRMESDVLQHDKISVPKIFFSELSLSATPTKRLRRIHWLEVHKKHVHHLTCPYFNIII